MTNEAGGTNIEHFTVAKLLACEHNPSRPHPQAPHDYRARERIPATELLRREGIHLEDRAEATTQRAHVGELQQEIGGPRTHRRAAAIGSAATLCGLTMAGLIALKPTTPPDGADSTFDEFDGSQFSLIPSLEETSRTTPVLKRALPSENTGDQPDTIADPASRGRTDDAGVDPLPVASNKVLASRSGAGVPPEEERPASEDNRQQPSPPPPEGSTTTISTPPSTDEPSDLPETKPKPKPSHPSRDNYRDDRTGDTSDGMLVSVLDSLGDLLDPVAGSISGTLMP